MTLVAAFKRALNRAAARGYVRVVKAQSSVYYWGSWLCVLYLKVEMLSTCKTK